MSKTTSNVASQSAEGLDYNLCLQAAHGRREFMNALELGRAQGYVTAWTKIR